MRKQLELLWELQKIDLAIRAIKEDRERYPKEMKRLDEKCRIEKDRIQKEKDKIESLEKERRQKEQHLSSELERIKRTETRMFDVKTNKEYQAILKEIETIEKKNSDNEDEIITAMEDVDNIKSVLETKEKDFDDRRSRYESEKQKIAQEISQLDVDLAECQQKSSDLRRQVRSELQKKYEIIKGARNGLAVVSVWKEVCGGCHMNIPPQLYIELQRSVDLLSCPNCNRIIYWINQGGTDA